MYNIQNHIKYVYVCICIYMYMYTCYTNSYGMFSIHMFKNIQYTNPLYEKPNKVYSIPFGSLVLPLLL